MICLHAENYATRMKEIKDFLKWKFKEINNKLKNKNGESYHENCLEIST